jgi:F0F1-type ATP synthase assembly protein I
MSQSEPARDPDDGLRDDTPEPKAKGGDPWHAFAYLVSGVLMYGALGWLADRWLGTSFLVVVGILFGAVLGIYATIKRFDALPKVGPGDRPGDARSDGHDEK